MNVYIPSEEERYKADLENFGKDNPIRFLNSRFLINESKKVQMNLIGSKRMIQSYDLAEEYYRIDRYLVFQKC